MTKYVKRHQEETLKWCRDVLKHSTDMRAYKVTTSDSVTFAQLALTGHETECKEFLRMLHGWTNHPNGTRGDLLWSKKLLAHIGSCEVCITNHTANRLST